MLEVAEDSLAYLRDTDEEQVVVVVARGPQARPGDPIAVAAGAVADGTAFVEVLTRAEATVRDGHLPVPSMAPGVAIWRAVTSPGAHSDIDL